MTQNIFEEIKHINEYGNEYWKAREFAKVLEYKDFWNFENVISKAKITCTSSWENIHDHFGEITEEVKAWSWAVWRYPSYQLSRYACYLVAMEADGSKREVWNAKKYFAIQTRKQEVSEQLLEDSKRKYLRDEMSKHNTALAETADKAWVKYYGVFTNYWYMGLYNWLDATWIHKKKWLKKSQKILDHMSSEELAANLFRATQAEAKLKREKILGQDTANQAHYDVGKEVRQTIKKLWGTMPEELPPTESIKQAEKRLKNSDDNNILE